MCSRSERRYARTPAGLRAGPDPVVSAAGGGGSRGGCDAARSIRAALAVVEDLDGERWPSVLQDFAAADQVAAETGTNASARSVEAFDDGHAG
jgi:hypothetical protein